MAVSVALLFEATTDQYDAAVEVLGGDSGPPQPEIRELYDVLKP